MLTGIAVTSYGICAVAFLLLAVLLATRWKASAQSRTTAIASALTAIWAGTVAVHTMLGAPVTIASELLELLRNAAWTVLLLRLLNPYRAEQTPRLANLKPFVKGVIGFYLALAVLVLFGRLMSGAPAGAAHLIGMLAKVAQAVVGMLLVEQLYRSAPLRERWSIKFACMGLGGLFAYDFYLFSDAMLFRALNAEIWIARGAINALTVPLIALSAARNPKWTLGIAVSRRAMFHSVALFGSAIYLLAMAAAGYYLRYFGGTWGNLMQGVFLAGAVALLVSVLFSGTFRSWLKVFISKHFYRYHYDYREEWLRFTRTLSAAGPDGPDVAERTLHAIANLVESTGAALYLARESGVCEPVAVWNLPGAEHAEPLDSPFSQFLQTKQWVVDLAEQREFPDLYDGVPAPDWLDTLATAWLVVPLVLGRDLRGFVVLAQPRSRMMLNWEVTDLLKIAGSQAASYLAQQESANALMVARQFESFNRMSTFLVHDLKNLVSQLSLVVANAEKHQHNPEFQRDMLETVDLSVQKMRLLLHKLARGSSAETPTRLILDKLLQRAVAMKSGAEPRPQLQLVDGDVMVLADAGRLERVIGHIVQNAVEATPRHGHVTVRLLKWQDEAIIECVDTGAGMNEEFIRTRLFKPFESTKSAGMGIGVFESREYIQELGGRIEVHSQQPGGTTFRIILPLQVTNRTPISQAA